MMSSIAGFSCAKPADFDQFPSPAVDLKVGPDAGPQSLILAGGCFWCTEGVYRQIPGVTEVISGYAGGTKETADYETVCTGKTDHAEAIKITYDPKLTSMGKLLKVFFSVAHDPTTLNRQGNDVGRQYRSAIFYADDEQKKVAETYIKQLNNAKVFGSPIVTTLEPLSASAFYEAERYHQNYAELNPNQGYIRGVALPKVEKAKKAAEKLKQSPTTQPSEK